MAKVVNSTFVSLDGVVNHMDKWHFDYLSDESDQLAMRQLSAADALLMGRRSYEVYAGAWPGRDGEYPDRINAMRKYVASTTLTDPEWNNTQVLSGDLVESVARLKDEHSGDILMHGYGPVAQAMIRAGLLDELHLWYHPVLAGVGGPDDVLLTEGLHAVFRTTGAEVFDNGIVVMSMVKRDD
ncbi:dihydrofolate reductase family protein [Phytoactinopolyspora halotolerans]|uniref:Bacterial bifunctional deaminase-reductase C-terminal domain-containing protein n=1 Tax=Phytoactinopolyspora halotolerans TaxID=1981512 RepID=A0A6L9SD91_9ACTN|nr:dihydrofolate reductase family protein [Phytoactinopolyspora halotolerans]NEE02518.1 hypothetical protein [Phytoactinopolyspora halotolerans]